MLTEEQVLAKCHVSSLEEVKNLTLWGNSLENIDIVSKMKNVEVVSLSLNKISSLKPFQNCSNLKELYLRKNSISDIQEINYLQNCKDLRILWLEENPLCDTPNYRDIVIQILPQVMKLDNVMTTENNNNNQNNGTIEKSNNNTIKESPSPMEETTHKTPLENTIISTIPNNPEHPNEQFLEKTNLQNIINANTDKTIDGSFLKETNRQSPIIENNCVKSIDGDFLKGLNDKTIDNFKNQRDDDMQTTLLNKNNIQATLINNQNKYDHKYNNDYCEKLNNIDDIKNFFASPYNKNSNNNNNNFLKGNSAEMRMRNEYGMMNKMPSTPTPVMFSNDDRNFAENYANYKRQSEIDYPSSNNNMYYNNQNMTPNKINDSLEMMPQYNQPQTQNIQHTHIVNAVLNLMEVLDARELIHVRNLINKKLRR